MLERTVWKYPIPYGVGDDSRYDAIQMPADAEILTVGLGPGDLPYVWALVDPKCAFFDKRRLGFFATGSAIPGGWQYIGTVHNPPTALVWHVFEGPR